MAVTQEISQVPQAPLRSEEVDELIYRGKVESFLLALKTLSQQLETARGQINDTEANINAKETSAAGAATTATTKAAQAGSSADAALVAKQDTIDIKDLALAYLQQIESNTLSWDTIFGKPSEFTPSDHDASKITSGVLSAARGGTGRTDGKAEGLATARSINGTPFDGGTNITTTTWGAARNITIAGTTKSVNGGANLEWTAAQLASVYEASKMFAPAGYLKLTNGFICQWATSLDRDSNNPVVFPIAFPNACYAVVTTQNQGATYGYNLPVQVWNQTKNGFSTQGNAGGIRFNYIAFGR